MNGSTSICPCDQFTHPQVISNPPGRTSIAYRVGDYIAFREALLRSRPGEVELLNWRPGAQGDLAVQMVEWWAYLADILTFYNERIANEDYLRTAVLPESVQRLIRTLGYRPRPGIGATGTVAALMTGMKPLTLPAGFQIQSKPGPGKQPQIFELGAQTLVQPPDAIQADPMPNPALLGNQNSSVLLQGVVKTVKAGDVLLLLEKGWTGNDNNYAVLTVASVTPEKDPRGRTNTRVLFSEAATQLASVNAADYRLLKSAQTAHVWQYPAVDVIADNHVDLDSIYRGIKVGDPVLFEGGQVSSTQGIYLSPDGTNLGGGGNTVSLGVTNRYLYGLMAYQSGVIASYFDGSIWYSPSGLNPGGGGDAQQVYSGNKFALFMIPYSTGVITVFENNTIYYSPDGQNLGGGGSTVAIGPATVSPPYLYTIITFNNGVVTGWSDTHIYFSPDGTNLGGGGSTQPLGNPSGMFPVMMISFKAGLITFFLQSSGSVIVYSTDGQNPGGGANASQVYNGPRYVVSLVSSQSGVLTAFDDGTVYLSSDGNNLGQATGQTVLAYSGPTLVANMIAYGTGVLTEFMDGSVYYSNDGKSLKGGGNTTQVYSSQPGPITFVELKNGSVMTAFPNPQLALASVTSYSEAIWYANPASQNTPDQPPTGSPPPIAIPIPHSRIYFRPTLDTLPYFDRNLTVVQFSWRDVGTLIPTPATTLTGTKVSLETALPASIVPLSNQPVLIGDKNGNGVQALASTNDPFSLGLSNISDPTQILSAPLTVLFDLLGVSRGKTVANETLGSGDANVATGQEFVLQKSPLTYLQNTMSTSGAGYASTLQVWVDGVKWQEVPSFYAQPANAQVFVTREDENNVTHVQFGDGVNGSRLPSGINNVVATYRYGSGAEPPGPDSLTVILKSWPGLKSIVNPVPAGGGADPDPPSQIKKYAPQSVLTFGRAVSADDYEVIAAQAPGVARARAYWAWDVTQERMMVKVYVGDDIDAVSSAATALAGASDPNRPLRVIQAQQVPITLSLTLVVDPKYVLDDVVSAATSALVDPDTGLLGSNVVQIGQSVFQSQVYQACLNVAGVRAVHAFTLTGATMATCSTCPNCDYRYDPGEGGFFTVTTPSDQIISPEVASNGS